ncbi:uncharacterized protein BP5553_04846 [Venustampulla echinocandica]|uniref:Uncharacterized protein n=1 Tax=Venustampulla echinocandica TaxID=2656787 RepID=A0A370TPG2_9HELO|nr:uncharacterized protein BP5553_04846 [Venustampulla echinocandica]RDL37413.1 hypothetical protein BP5553_04846 [Venustampulla echinocandica]
MYAPWEEALPMQCTADHATPGRSGWTRRGNLQTFVSDDAALQSAVLWDSSHPPFLLLVLPRPPHSRPRCFRYPTGSTRDFVLGRRHPRTDGEEAGTKYNSSHSMAHARRTTPSAVAETCRLPPPLRLPNTLRLHAVQGESVGAHEQTCRLPTDSAVNKLQTDGSNIDNQDHDQKLSPQGQELAAMLEQPLSPPESSREASANHSTPKVKPQYTTSASSAPKTSSPVKSPPRQDSSYFSALGDIDGDDDGSTIDADIQARQVRARERVFILRGRVSRSREAKRDQRDELRRLREDVRDATHKLMNKVNEIEAFGHIEETLAPYLAKLREAQDALGPVEDAYDRFEDKLDDEEQELEQEEYHFYRNYAVPLPSILESDPNLDAEISPLIKPYIPPDTEFEGSPLDSGLVEEYLEAVARAGQIGEQLDNLEEDYHRFSADASFSNRYDLPVSVKASHVLSEYQVMRADLLQNLRKVEDEVFDLRDLCLDQQLFSNHEYVYERRDALYEEVMDSVDEALDRSPLRMAAYHANFYGRELDYEDKRQYVNNWLLQWVQDSTYECLVLKTWIYLAYPDLPQKDSDLADDKWSELALENWNNDSAGLYTNEFYSASMFDVITGNTGKLNTTLLGMSGITDFMSLDVDLDALERLEDALGHSRNGTPTTSSDDGSTPKKKRIKVYKPKPRSVPSLKLAKPLDEFNAAHRST